MVQCLKALADENRLRILMLLRERELCVFEIMGVLGLSQPLVSSHLGVLRAAGLVDARREGKRMRYALTDVDRPRRRAPRLGGAGGAGQRCPSPRSTTSGACQRARPV